MLINLVFTTLIFITVIYIYIYGGYHLHMNETTREKLFYVLIILFLCERKFLNS